MQSSVFQIREHVVPCQHVREYRGATNGSQDIALKLAVKQYIPLDHPDPIPGEITIIGMSANGFPKELYEPLWEDVYRRCKAQHKHIRSIWIGDMSHQGASGILNENELGNEPSWFDHTRDLMNMINIFGQQMPRPIFGVGHSMGAAQLVALSVFHPCLFSGIVLIDPAIIGATSPPPGEGFATASTYRRDHWSSRLEAVESMRKKEYYNRWDERVFRRYVEFGLRQLPTIIYPTVPDEGSTPVTLATTKHQEVFTFLRPSFDRVDDDGNPYVDPQRIPDLDPSLPRRYIYPFYRPEPMAAFKMLAHLRPTVLWIFGAQSGLSLPEMRQERLSATGIGVGANGGERNGKVTAVTINESGHLVAFEKVPQCAEAIANWLTLESQGFRSQPDRQGSLTDKNSVRDALIAPAAWKRMLGGKL